MINLREYIDRVATGERICVVFRDELQLKYEFNAMLRDDYFKDFVVYKASARTWYHLASGGWLRGLSASTQREHIMGLIADVVCFDVEARGRVSDEFALEAIMRSQRYGWSRAKGGR